MKFIHFGCWNNIDCKTTNFRDIVLDYIKENEKDFKCIIVSGDNWYTNKLDAYKYYFTNVLYSGMIKLYELNKPCHIILGNHDEDIAENDTPYDDRKNNCMLNSEKFFIQRINSSLEYLVPTLDSLKNIGSVDSLGYLSKNTDFRSKPQSKLLLHESIYMPEYTIYGKCIFIFINTNISKTPETRQRSYIKYIELLLKDHNDKIPFIVGHVPITSKSVKNEKEIITQFYAYNTDIIDYFINTIKPYKPIYLCADTHNFQISDIDKNIAQIVVGTGGAEPDVLKMVPRSINYKFLEKYNVKGFINNSFGYSIIEIHDNTIIVTYKHLISIDNKIVNKKYVFEIKRGENIDINFQGIYHLSSSLNILNAEINKKLICSNLTQENIVKSNDVYCYRKPLKK